MRQNFREHRIDICRIWQMCSHVGMNDGFERCMRRSGDLCDVSDGGFCLLEAFRNRFFSAMVIIGFDSCDSRRCLDW